MLLYILSYVYIMNNMNICIFNPEVKIKKIDFLNSLGRLTQLITSVT